MTALASPTHTGPTAPPKKTRKVQGRFWYVVSPLAVAILAAAGVAALYRVFIRTTLGQQIDTSALQGGDVHHERVVEVLSRTLNGTTLVSLVAACLAAATIGVLRKRVDLAVGAAFMVLGANGSCQLLKTHLPRPDLDGTAMPNSFPSGHTAAAASVVAALILVLPQAVRGMVAMIGAGYVTVIAVATVWAEWHRPSDTVAAALLVLAWSAFVAFVVRLFRSAHPGEPERHSRVGFVVLAIVAVVAGAAGVLGLITVAMSQRVTPDLVSGKFAFLTGSAGMAAVVAGVFLIWVRLASGDRPGTAPTKAAPRRRKGGKK
jgi:membrane-associated phospholipid phosphatase